MVKINEIQSTATFAFSHDPIPVLATGTAAGVIDDSFSSSSSLNFYSLYGKDPLLSVEAESKFYDLDWSRNGSLLAGALENGKVQFWNTENLSSKKVEAVATGEKHTALIKSLQFNPIQHNILVSGGSNSELYIWDTNKLTNLAPFAPGVAMTPMDTITSVSWNNSVSHIFAAAGTAGYTSIWDLKAKKEVLHLSYSSPTGSRATLSTVAWHPTQSTKLLTASESDGVPVILSWDLRNSNAPETILTGHKKGILSLDWNARDPSLLLSSGKDNTTILWNPITSEKIAQYPTTANWAFKTRFAPSTPDIFATSSFDKKVIVQSLQDTSPPISKRTQSANESEFWTQISENETQQPEYFTTQAPNWYGRKSSVAFGFGGKIVTVGATGQQTSEIKVLDSKLPGSSGNEALKKALDSADYKEIIDSRLENSFENVNKPDWELLNGLSSETDIFEKFIGLKLEDDATETKAEKSTDDDFFTHLTEEPNQYAPSGSFKVSSDSKDLTNALLSKNFSKAIDISLKDGKLVEALIIALNGPDELKNKVKNFYFNKFAGEDSIARLLYSVSSDNVSDLVENGDISNWREIGTAIKTYTSDNKDIYKTYFTKLGDRLLAADPVANRNDAIINYINASSIDKAANIWSDELKTVEAKFLDSAKTSAYDAHFDSLTEFVEKFSAYRSVLKLDTPINESERFISTILEYTNIISTNGQFELASKFLNLLSDSIPAVKLEKERIAIASGITNKPVQPASKTGAARYGAVANNQIPNTAASTRGRTPAIANPYFPQGNVASVPGSNQFSQPPAQGVPYGQPPAPAAGNPYAQPSGYAPQATAPSGSFPPATPANPYKPVAAAAAAVNPYKPVDAPNPLVNPTPVPPPPPPKNGRKISTDGWNDLPSTFHQPRIATPAAAVNVTNGAQRGATPPPSLSRVSSFANPPSVPPPPRSVSKSRKTPVLQEAKPNIPSPANSRYAPVAAASPKPTDAVNGGFAAPPQPQQPPYGNSTPLAPPVNPYAIPAQQPANQFTPPANPYAPPPPVAGAQTPSQPPVNPYAPPANSVPAPGVPSAYAPPPQATQPPPPRNAYSQPQQPAPQQVGPPPVGPPRGSTSAAASVEQAEQQQIAEEKAKPKHPSGDRSHIPESQLKIYQVLDAEFNTAKPSIPENFSKQVADTAKRLNILYDHLNNQDLLSEVVIGKLSNLADLLNEKNTVDAQNVYLDIATNHSSEGGHWLVGVKRLIQFVDACR